MTGAPGGPGTGTAPITADAFEARVGEEFVFGRPPDEKGSTAGVARMTLTSLTRLPRHDFTDRQPFSIIFTMMSQPPLGLGLHRLLDPELEPVEMFLSRVAAPRLQKANPTGMFYEAIFN